jgi:hypothetical protein
MSFQPVINNDVLKNAPVKPIAVRIAANSEGERISELVKETGFIVDGFTWNNIAPYWLVAEVDGVIIGCIQVCLSLPVGRIEMLAVDKRLSHVTRARVIYQLCITAGATLKAAGAQMATSLISFKNKPWKQILKRRGCVSIGVGNVMAHRL